MPRIELRRPGQSPAAPPPPLLPVPLSATQVRPPPSNGVFATACLSPTRNLAVMYWARYQGNLKPLILCDYEVGPLQANSWAHVREALEYWRKARNSRLPYAAGLFVETEFLAAQAIGAGCSAHTIPEWLVKQDAWNQVVQSAAAILAAGDVGMTQEAAARMEQRPFLTQIGATAVVPPEDPILPTLRAYLFGVVLALDEVAARDPHPKEPKRAARN